MYIIIIPVQGKWNKIKNSNRGTPQQCQHMEILWLPEFSDCQHADINKATLTHAHKALSPHQCHI